MDEIGGRRLLSSFRTIFLFCLSVFFCFDFEFFFVSQVFNNFYGFCDAPPEILLNILHHLCIHVFLHVLLNFFMFKCVCQWCLFLYDRLMFFSHYLLFTSLVIISIVTHVFYHCFHVSLSFLSFSSILVFHLTLSTFCHRFHLYSSFLPIFYVPSLHSQHFSFSPIFLCSISSFSPLLLISFKFIPQHFPRVSSHHSHL